MKKAELEAHIGYLKEENKRLEKEYHKLRIQFKANKYEEAKIELKHYMTGGYFETEVVLKRFRNATGAELFDKVVAGIIDNHVAA